MTKRVLYLILLTFACLPAAASQPGEPLDCSDWHLNAAGLQCAVYAPVTSGPSTKFAEGGDNVVLDNVGNFYTLREGVDPGGVPDSNIGSLEIWRYDGGHETLIAWIEDRLRSDGVDHIRPYRSGTALAGPLHFDLVDGRLLIPVRSYCEVLVDPVCTYGDPGFWIMALTGFTPLRDVIPSGPQGPAGPPGPQGPPGPLIPACPDADGDGFRNCNAIPGCTPYGSPCGDCDDHDPEVNPGLVGKALEKGKKDGKDNDCNGVIDG